ncbi:PBP1A family penicillin-binding protein [Bacillus sp. SM2101]|uniref:transglycosylase domain-containing protein n=1 Tax=Bacillus sp. SM2101 TaxID=2805366 RepID=UPI001BDDDE5E|nr:PBP1A family penicillin-binding protein [Bacillus sp. SM2101]
MEIITNQRFKKALKYFRALIFVTLILLIFMSVTLISLFTYATVKGAPPLTVPQSTIYYANDDVIIGESHSKEKRYWISLDHISPSLIAATIAIEDQSFFSHPGFDFKRIAGAALADIKALAKVQGASTITQQYARNLFLEHDKTWRRKFDEALYTIRLEMNYSKNDILEGYLNTIYYGHGTYGIEAAAQYYFGKSANDLMLSEASMLAGVPKGPSHYSPLINEEKAKDRQWTILNAMVNNNYITENEASKAYEQELQYIEQQKVKHEEVGLYFQDIVKNELVNKLNIDERIIEMGGLHVYTTLDIELQKLAEESISNTINPSSDIQVSFVALDQYTGEVKALVGGRDYDESPFNRAVQAERQPGSTFKPFLYYAALEKGFTASTKLRSEQTTFIFDEGRATYTPHNYNNYYADDTITLAQAMALSDNVYAVKTNLYLGNNILVETAKKLGITSKLDNVPSLALGTSPVRMIDMVQAYATIANNGKQIHPTYITKVIDHHGNIIFEEAPSPEQVLDPDLAFVTTQLMKGMFDEKLNDYTNVTGSIIQNDLTRLYAGKSGTTKTDSWMIGYSPQIVTGIWTGYDRDYTIDKVDERAYSKRIWANFMEQSLTKEPVLTFRNSTGNLKKVYINPDNGKLATNDCPITLQMYYVKGTEPEEYCDEHSQKPPLDKKQAPIEDKGWFKRFIDWFN